MRISDWSSDVCSSDLMGADLGAAQCLGELRTDIRIVQFALGGLDHRAATAEVDQRVHHLVLVFEIMGTTEVDVDVVRLEKPARGCEARLLSCDYEGAAGLAEADEFGKLRLDDRDGEDRQSTRLNYSY